ncbi:conserved hypothetical protein [Perkinsus marinus ATCC 50983]|uniref:ALA-interacting subunit n=1 Tax=Perkinsus marinus (strain ATCC 50983 / TXsc) TaxID=423536 RepID=C5KAQ3_PERM5|nr:conserved hypothetical protein [Perkinsus marinus ATCC 50983]EER18229.1 conserved hypothetical protein [Perkinsus marinus ATCC 50983]|eukprot:XP_002786433.1 conserved hypothetical protein [Perkinsus marinus ATCC 50983]
MPTTAPEQSPGEPSRPRNRQGRQRKQYDNDLIQQRIRAWQPLLSPKWVIATFIAFAAAFVAIGIGLVEADKSTNEQSVDYTDLAADGGVFPVQIEVNEDMKAPIYVYYELTNFYQNHRRYIASRDYSQLASHVSTSRGANGDCSPWERDEFGRNNYPCGLIARSTFNDSYIIDTKRINSAVWEQTNITETNTVIAWEDDVQYKYDNLDPEGSIDQGIQNQVSLNMWLNFYFPPQVCVSTADIGYDSYGVMKVPISARQDSSEYKKIYVMSATADSATNHTACTNYITDQAQCKFTLVPGGVDGVDPEFACSAAEGYERKLNPAGWGLLNGRFIGWMRPAGLPTFRKMYARIDDDLKVGDVLRFTVSDNFPTAQYGGTKSIVIATTTWAGGKNGILGYSYIAVGVICGVFAIVFGITYLRKKNRLGNPEYLSWGES